MRAKMRAKPQDDTEVNLVHEDIVVNLFDTYVVYNTHRGEKIIILDPGAPLSLAGRPWLDLYLQEFDYTVVYMVSLSCYQVFIFGGIDKKHKSRILIELSLRSMKGIDEVLKAKVYVQDADVPFICG